MDYKGVYDRLIKRALDRQWCKSTAPCYVEKHHILPKCLGGSDDVNNLVILTAREHFVAHLLLVKIYPSEDKILFAAHMLTRVSRNHRRVNNRDYEWLKKKRSLAMSNMFAGVSKTESHKNNMRGKRPHVSQKGALNNAFKGFINTPYGVFESLKDAAIAENVNYTTIAYRINSTSSKFIEYKRVQN